MLWIHHSLSPLLFTLLNPVYYLFLSFTIFYILRLSCTLSYHLSLRFCSFINDFLLSVFNFVFFYFIHTFFLHFSPPCVLRLYLVLLLATTVVKYSSVKSADKSETSVWCPDNRDFINSVPLFRFLLLFMCSLIKHKSHTKNENAEKMQQDYGITFLASQFVAPLPFLGIIKTNYF